MVSFEVDGACWRAWVAERGHDCVVIDHFMRLLLEADLRLVDAFGGLGGHVSRFKVLLILHMEPLDVKNEG